MVGNAVVEWMSSGWTPGIVEAKVDFATSMHWLSAFDLSVPPWGILLYCGHEDCTVPPSYGAKLMMEAVIIQDVH